MARSPFVGWVSYQPPCQAASAVITAFTPSRNTKLWREVLAEPHQGRMRSTMSGNRAPQWKVCWAPMEKPVTRARRSRPNCSVTRRCWHRMLSYSVTDGKRARSYGGGVLLGDEDRPLPNMLGMMMKYLPGSSAIPEPIMGSFC